MSEEDEPKHIAPRHADPPRPDFVAGLPIQLEVPRPRIVVIAFALVVLSALAFIPYTADAVPRRGQIRTRLEEKLAERSPDYPAGDIENAVLIVLIGAAVLSVVFILLELRGARRLHLKIESGRTWLLILMGLHLPVIAISPVLRDGGRNDVISALAQGACLVLAVLLAYLPPTSRWLAATRRQGPIPLRTTEERQS